MHRATRIETTLYDMKRFHVAGEDHSSAFGQVPGETGACAAVLKWDCLCADQTGCAHEVAPPAFVHYQ